MKYNQLTKIAPRVSEIGLGTWQLGVNSGWKGLTEKEAITMVQTALDTGVNFFDTAPNYGLGTSEERLGKALKGTDRDAFVINTKFGHTVAGNTNYSSSHILTSLEGSLKRLQLDYVDSFIFHNPPFEYLDGNQNDHYEILEKLKDEGKIKAYGASLDTAKEMRVFMETTGGEVIEAFFNILHQDTASAFDLALEKRVGIIVKIPFDSGWLTGKYHENSVFDGVRARWSTDDIKTRARLIRRLQTIIGDEVKLIEAALLFPLAHEAVTTVIPGNTSLLHLENNLNVVNLDIERTLVEQFQTFYQDEVKELNLPW